MAGPSSQRFNEPEVKERLAKKRRVVIDLTKDDEVPVHRSENMESVGEILLRVNKEVKEDNRKIRKLLMEIRDGLRSN